MTYSKKLGPWPDYGRRPMERGSKLEPLGIFTISMKFLIEAVPSCPILKIWDFGRIEELATVASGHEVGFKMILALRPFKQALTC